MKATRNYYRAGDPVLIKNITAHLDVCHDGRPLPAYGSAEIAEDDLELPFYQTRLADGLILVVPPEAPPDGTKTGPAKPRNASRKKATKAEETS